MNRLPFSPARWLAAGALAIAVLAPKIGLAQTAAEAPAKPTFTPEIRADVMKQVTRLITEKAFVPGVDFTTWNQMLDKHKDSIEKADTSDKFVYAVNNALQDFHFSHIVLISPRAMEMRFQRNTVGIGVGILPDKDGLLVTRVVEGAPAAEAGLVPGDILMESGGKKITDPAQIRGEEGTSVTIKVKREDGTIKDFTFVRKKFKSIIPETLTWANPDTAVLKVPTFDVTYDSKRVEGLMKDASKAKQLILDLRGNGGGVVFNMLHLLGMILPDDTAIGTFVNRRNADEFVKNGGDIKDLKGMAESVKSKLRITDGALPVFAGKVAVLLDSGSASASEIAAVALKETTSAPVIGQRSAGAVLASVIVPVSNGFNLQYPIYDYVSIKGLRLEGNGIAPDAEAKSVVFLRKGEKDPGVENALALLAKGGAH